MGKVKISRAQAEAIKNLKELYVNNSDEFMNYQLIDEKLKTGYKWENNEIKEASNIPNRDFIKLLHYGYEVEEKFEVGDWVVHEGDRAFELSFPLANPYNINHLRHATESEIAEEEKRRMGSKIDGLLVGLSSGERVRLREKLECGDY